MPTKKKREIIKRPILAQKVAYYCSYNRVSEKALCEEFGISNYQLNRNIDGHKFLMHNQYIDFLKKIGIEKLEDLRTTDE